MTEVIAPNGLPAVVVRHDGVHLEHEHADHPTYKFPVMAEFVGERPADLESWDGSYEPKTLALIYTDGCVALTFYECGYDLWLLDTGTHRHGSSFRGGWQLQAESREQVLRAAPPDTRGFGLRGAPVGDHGATG